MPWKLRLVHQFNVEKSTEPAGMISVIEAAMGDTAAAIQAEVLTNLGTLTRDRVVGNARTEKRARVIADALADTRCACCLEKGHLQGNFR